MLMLGLARETSTAVLRVSSNHLPYVASYPRVIVSILS